LGTTILGTPPYEAGCPKSTIPLGNEKSKWPAEGLSNLEVFEKLHVSLRSMGLLFMLTYTPDIGKSPCSIGNTSSNGGFFIVMLVFGRVHYSYTCFSKW